LIATARQSKPACGDPEKDGSQKKSAKPPKATNALEEVTLEFFACPVVLLVRTAGRPLIGTAKPVTAWKRAAQGTTTFEARR
jgi:hypothetical protein